MEFRNLTEEQKAKVRELTTPEEVLEFAKAEGIDLTDEELGDVSGGWGVEDCEFDPDYR